MAGKTKKTEKAKGKAKGNSGKAAVPPAVEEMVEKGSKLMQELEARNDPEFQALALLEDLAELDNPAEIRGVARKALALDPRCVVAWMELAMASDSAEEALPHSERAFAIVVEDFREAGLPVEEDGALTARLEGMLYARARMLLADCLEELGRGEESMAHRADLLRLDPSDEAGARYPVAAGMLAAGEHELLGELFEAFEADDSGLWLFTKALQEFRIAGDSGAARKALKRAKDANPHIIALLIDEDAELPEDWEREDDSGDYLEAVQYADDFGGAWTATPGALRWLAAK